MNLELYLKVKALEKAFSKKEKVDGKYFISVYNEIYNTNHKFSNCCPSENKAKFRKLKHTAKVWEVQNPEAAKLAGIKPEIILPEASEGVKQENQAETPEEEKTETPAPPKKKRGRPRKNSK